MSYLFLVIGLIILAFGGDFLVKSAVSITKKMNVSPLLIGVTVVSFGTSFPELLVSLQAAIDGNSGIAIGNVIGSNIANIALVLGITAVISPMLINRKSYFSSWLFMLFSALLFIWFSIDLVISFNEGLSLVFLLIVFILFSIKFNKSGLDEIKNDIITSSLPLIILYFILGSAGLYFGSELLVENAVIIAKNWGISELVIGVTVIALGTSLPELVTSCLAAIKGHNNISIGNLIGSNIFNVFAVIGITASVKPINVDESVLYFDFPVMLGITLFLGCILLGSKINRAIGYALLVAYFTYILFSIL
jgi:cation:H+ antiporter